MFGSSSKNVALRALDAAGLPSVLDRKPDGMVMVMDDTLYNSNTIERACPRNIACRQHGRAHETSQIYRSGSDYDFEHLSFEMSSVFGPSSKMFLIHLGS